MKDYGFGHEICIVAGTVVCFRWHMTLCVLYWSHCTGACFSLWRRILCNTGLQADPRPKSVGLVWGRCLALFYILQMNWVDSGNDFVMVTALCTFDSPCYLGLWSVWLATLVTKL